MLSNAYLSIKFLKRVLKKIYPKEVNFTQGYTKINDPRTLNQKRKCHTIAAK